MPHFKVFFTSLPRWLTIKIHKWHEKYKVICYMSKGGAVATVISLVTGKGQGDGTRATAVVGSQAGEGPQGRLLITIQVQKEPGWSSAFLSAVTQPGCRFLGSAGTLWGGMMLCLPCAGSMLCCLPWLGCHLSAITIPAKMRCLLPWLSCEPAQAQPLGGATSAIAPGGRQACGGGVGVSTSQATAAFRMRHGHFFPCRASFPCPPSSQNTFSP